MNIEIRNECFICLEEGAFNKPLYNAKFCDCKCVYFHNECMNIYVNDSKKCPMCSKSISHTIHMKKKNKINTNKMLVLVMIVLYAISFVVSIYFLAHSKYDTLPYLIIVFIVSCLIVALNICSFSCCLNFFKYYGGTDYDIKHYYSLCYYCEPLEIEQYNQKCVPCTITTSEKTSIVLNRIIFYYYPIGIIICANIILNIILNGYEYDYLIYTYSGLVASWPICMILFGLGYQAVAWLRLLYYFCLTDVENVNQVHEDYYTRVG